MAINMTEPRVLPGERTGGLFRDDFTTREYGFVSTPTYSVTKLASAGMLCGTGGDDSIMLETIMLLLGLEACALILIAFWGLDVLGIRGRRH
jgi:hypothetical protein